MHLRFVVRRLAQQPMFTATAVLTIALGIGATTAMFSVLDAVLLRPLPFRDPENLVEVRTVNRGGAQLTSHTFEGFVQWRQQTDLFSVFEGYSQRAAVLAGAAEPVRVVVVAVTGGVMPTLGVAPRLGRMIVEDDARPGHERVLVLGDALWRTQFGGDLHVVGRTARLDDGVFEIVGVMPPAFKFPRSSAEAWTALPVVKAPAGASARPFGTMARLAPGVTLDAAQSRVVALQPAFAETMPRGDGWSLRVFGLNANRANPRPRLAMLLLMAAAALLLLIACANVANLLIARGVARERELAVRAALGASRWRLVRELLTESVVLAAAGGAAGGILAYWWTSALVALAPTQLTFLSLSEIQVDLRVLAFGAALTTVAALLFGLVPALRGARRDVQDPLKSATRSATGSRRQRRLISLVVVAEFALSLTLLVGAGLLIRTFTHLTSVDPGFDTRNLLALSIELPSWKYTTQATSRAFWSDVLDRVRAVPGVVDATVTPGIPPGTGGFSFDLRLEAEGNPEVIEGRDVILPFSTVSPDYFRVMRIPLKAGRIFTAEDTPQSPKAIIVNEALAGRLWPHGNAVGGRMRLDNDADDPWYTVVGVVGTVYQFDFAKGRDMVGVYYPSSQSRESGPGRYQTLAVRTADDPLAHLHDLRGAIRAIDPDQPILKIETIEQAYAEFLSAPRFYAALMVIFAGVGLLLAAVGLYGVLAFTTTERTSEFGIRVALGATRRDVLLLVLRHGLGVAALGVALGLAGAFAATRTMTALLVGVSPHDPSTFIAVALALGAAALAACLIPGRRAVLLDPVVALRHE